MEKMDFTEIGALLHAGGQQNGNTNWRRACQGKASARSSHATVIGRIYASVFYSYFAALGFDVRVEDCTNHGRIDMAVLLPERVYLFEFKVVELQPEGRALQQLQDKNYAEKYLARGGPIDLIGVEFSSVARNVVEFSTSAGDVRGRNG